MKIALTATDQPKAQEAHAELSKRYDIVDTIDANIIIALGGDGLSTACSRCSFLPVGFAFLGVGGIPSMPWGEPCAAPIRSCRGSRLGANAMATPRCDGWNAGAALE